MDEHNFCAAYSSIESKYMDKEELEEEIEILLNPEPEEDDFFLREWPHSRITDFHKLDCSYLKTFNWEGSSIHPHSRICGTDEKHLHSLSRNMGVSNSLFGAGIRLFADSMIAYHDKVERKGEIRYYPPVIMTFWAGFETYVRYSSELMLITVNDIPQLIADYLREQEAYVKRKGEECIKDRYRPLLDRYAILLKYGYNYKVDRGSKHWQDLQKAKDLRDYYTHLDIHDPRAVSSIEVLNYMEAIMMALIWPSCELKRTLLIGVYRLYEVWARLKELQSDYVEQPFFKDWPRDNGYMFHCNFDKVDNSRFPNMNEMHKRKQQ